MRKLWILTILFAFIMAACGANPGGFIEDTPTETTAAAETTAETTAEPTTTKATMTSTTKAVRQIQAVALPTTEATTMAIKTVPLNIESNGSTGTLKFTEAKIDHEYGLLKLFFTFEAANDFEFDYDNIGCTDKNGKSLSKVAYGGTINRPAETGTRNITVDDGSMFFGKVDSTTDLSTITLTYAFKNADPVTVTFDIPGI